MRPISALVVAAVAFATAGCGSSDDQPSAGEGTDDASVTIAHAFGKTTISEKPERVATVGWASHDSVLALGVVPVGMPEQVYADPDGNGVHEWTEEKLRELDAETPALFDEADGVDFEAVADTRPDVILATYSGVTKDDYEKLSKIAPVVAYPGDPWGTPWRETITTNGRALGLADEATRLVDDLEQLIDENVAERPELEGKNAVFSWVDPKAMSDVGFYTTRDPRVQFLKDLSLEPADVVVQESGKTENYDTALSAEEADRLAGVDVIVAFDYADSKALATAQADPLWSKIPAIARGSVVTLEDGSPMAAAVSPTALTIPWGIDEYLDEIGIAAEKVR